MNQATITQAIRTGGTALGIELGSTRIKATLAGPLPAAPLTGQTTRKTACGATAWKTSGPAFRPPARGWPKR